MVLSCFVPPDYAQDQQDQQKRVGPPIDLPLTTTTLQLAQLLLSFLAQERAQATEARCAALRALTAARRSHKQNKRTDDDDNDASRTEQWTAAQQERLEALRDAHWRESANEGEEAQRYAEWSTRLELLASDLESKAVAAAATGDKAPDVTAVLRGLAALPFAFVLMESGHEIRQTLGDAIPDDQQMNAERLLHIQFFPQASFLIRSISRCSATVPGHTDAVLCLSFSPDARWLASGSGDRTVRLWDPDTQLPRVTLAGHQGWVLILAWSPDARWLASGSMDHTIRIWDVESELHSSHRQGIGCSKARSVLTGHSRWITALCWEPYHCSDGRCERLASASKDGTIRLWNVRTGRCERSLSGHRAGVTALRWSGRGMLYSASQDCTIQVWDAQTGACLQILQIHGHWVNTMALSSDYLLRCGAFAVDDETMNSSKVDGRHGIRARRLSVAEAADRLARLGAERLCAGSDDHTLSLITLEPDEHGDWSQARWRATRLTGHQQLVNHVSFSPDGRWIASASFDKSVRLWNGFSGKHVTTFRQHVQAVYMCCWSADARLLASASKDSTVKVYDIRQGGLKRDLPGHADEVYAIDWSMDGRVAATGGKDCRLKLWR